MDTGTTILGLIIVLLILLPILLISQKTKQKEKLFLQSIFKLAKDNKCKISENDHWNYTAIGIDKSECKLFYIQKRADKTDQKIINLADVLKCRVIQSGRTINRKDSNQTVIDKLGLGFIYRDRNNTETVVEFFNSDYDSAPLYGEPQLIEKWFKIVNEAAANTK